MRLRRQYLRIAIFLYLILATTSAIATDPIVYPIHKQVLIVHSAYQGYPWTDSLNRGIDKAFSNSSLTAELQYEYLDTKRYRDPLYFEGVMDLWREKYGNQHLDLVFVCDNEAYDFVLQEREGLFKDIPIVFAAYIGYEEDMLVDLQPITGVVQETDIIKTIELALELHPKTEKVVFLSPGTPQFRMNWLIGLDDYFKDSVELITLPQESIEEIDIELQSLGNDIVVIPLNSILLPNGTYIPFDEFVSYFSQDRAYPMYALWDIALGNGVVGGVMVTGSSQGEKAAELAISLLQGTPITDVPVILESPNQYLLDYTILEKFNINVSKLPEDSIIVNKPSSFIAENALLVIMTFIIILILLLLITLLSRSVMRLQKTQEELSLFAKDLESSEMRFKNMIMKSPLPMIVIDPGQNINFFNDRFTQQFGYTIDDIHLLEDWWQQVYPDPTYRETVKDTWNKAIEESKLLGSDMAVQQWTITTKNRSMRICEFYMYPVQEMSLIIMKDVTEEKEMEQKLRDSEEQFRVLADELPAIYAEWLPDSSLLYTNKAFGELFGDLVQENTAIRLLDLIPEKTFNKIKSEYLSLTAANPFGTSIIPITIHQTEYWIEWRYRGIFDETEELILIHGLGSDVTKGKIDQEERERLTFAIEQAGETILITNKDGDIQYCNPIFEKITGYSRNEVIGQNPRFLKSGDKDLAFYQELWATITQGKVWTGQFTNKRKDGALFIEAATISPIKDKTGEIINFVAVKRDITETMRLEAQFQQSQKMESVGRLAGGVAHDFNNMLSVIIGYTEIAKESNLENTLLSDNLDQVLDAANRSKEITQQLLAFARKQTIKPIVIDLNSNIADMLNMLKRLIGEEISLRWQPGDLLSPIKIDPSQLNQILVNLCINSRDAIDEQGEIRICTFNRMIDEEFCIDKPYFRPGGYVVLSVEDNGIGMEKSMLKKIFEPFFTTKELYKGTGLGLSSVYGIIKQNDGYIHVESEPGNGSVFEIFFKQIKTELDLIKSEDHEKIPMGSGELILIVEDEGINIELYQTMLKHLGYEVLIAMNGTEAINIYKDHRDRISLLLSDVILPGMNGRELSDTIQSLDPSLKTLFMSGYTTDIIAKKGVLDKGDFFIQKPFSIYDIACKVRSVLDEN